MSEKKRIDARKRSRDVSEVEMVHTGDSRMFSQQQPQQREEYAKPKGVKTREAIAQHLSKKLKITDDLNLQTLVQFDRQSRVESQDQDDFWKRRLVEERERLTEARQNQEEELRKVIEQARMDDFPMTEPHVVMMTNDLQEKLKRER